MIIDGHQHFWDPARADYPWMEAPELAGIRRAFGPADLAAEPPGVTLLYPIGQKEPIGIGLVVLAHQAAGELRRALQIAGLGFADDDFTAHGPSILDLIAIEHARLYPSSVLDSVVRTKERLMTG